MSFSLQPFLHLLAFLSLLQLHTSFVNAVYPEDYEGFIPPFKIVHFDERVSQGMAPKSKFVAGKPRVKIEVPPPAPAQPTWKRAWVVENGVKKLKWVEEEKPESPVAMRRPTPFAGKKALMFRRIPPSTYSGSVEQIDRRWKSKVVKFVQLDEEEEEQPPPPAAAAPPAESHWQLDPPDLEEMRAFGNALADFHREKNQSQNRMWFSAPEDIYKDMRAAQPVVDRALTQPATIKEMARFENDNALFRAISYALSSTEKFGAVVRDKVLDYYSQTPVGRRRRITNLQRGENGELPEVEAAARALDVNILVFKEEGAEWTCFSAHPEHPQDTQDVKKPTIALLLASSGHYEVILEVQ